MSVLDELLKTIGSDLQLVRRDLCKNVDSIRNALEAYEQAVEEAHVRAYCQKHSLRHPPLRAAAPEAAVQRLLASVRALPELVKDAPLAASAELKKERVEAVEDLAQLKSSAPPAPSPIAEQFRLKFPELTNAAETRKLLVFGAFSGRTKSLPDPLQKSCEWIDTSGEGNRSVINAVKRIRQGHVFSIIICDQAIQHQHAEPAVAAARALKLPVGYAAKGGNASLARALENIEETLSQG